MDFIEFKSQLYLPGANELLRQVDRYCPLACLTYFFSTIKIQYKLHFALTQILMQQSSQYFAHITFVLLWLKQKATQMWKPGNRSQHKDFSSNLDKNI